MFVSVKQKFGDKDSGSESDSSSSESEDEDARVSFELFYLGFRSVFVKYSSLWLECIIF